jgi:hypothetical protein
MCLKEAQGQGLGSSDVRNSKTNSEGMRIFWQDDTVCGALLWFQRGGRPT